MVAGGTVVVGMVVVDDGAGVGGGVNDVDEVPGPVARVVVDVEPGDAAVVEQSGTSTE
jgi:hypothetical protein